MYGNGVGGAVSPRPQSQPPQPREQVSQINAETINLYESALRSLDGLLDKTVGPRPSDASNCEIGPPSLTADAKRLNILAHQITARLEELHSLIGHDKQ